MNGLRARDWAILIGTGIGAALLWIGAFLVTQWATTHLPLGPLTGPLGIAALIGGAILAAQITADYWKFWHGRIPSRPWRLGSVTFLVLFAAQNLLERDGLHTLSTIATVTLNAFCVASFVELAFTVRGDIRRIRATAARDD